MIDTNRLLGYNFSVCTLQMLFSIVLLNIGVKFSHSFNFQYKDLGHRNSLSPDVD